MKDPVTSYPDARLPSTDKQCIADIVINNLPLFSGLCISAILSSDLVEPSCSSVKVAVESKDLTFAMMPVSAETQT